MSVALKWAETIGHKSAESFYEYLGIAIMVEEYGVNLTAKKIKKSQKYVKTAVEAYTLSGMPHIRMEEQDYLRALNKLFQSMLNDKEQNKNRTLTDLAKRLSMPVIALKALLDNQ